MHNESLVGVQTKNEQCEKNLLLEFDWIYEIIEGDYWNFSHDDIDDDDEKIDVELHF